MKKTWIMAALVAVAGLAGSASAASVGTGTGLNAPNAGTITIAANGSITVVQPSGTYDNVEDVVYNVFNNSAIAYTGFTVTGINNAPIAGFDGDGIDNYAKSDGSSKGNYGDNGLGGDGSNTTAQGYAGYDNAGTANTYSGFVQGGSTVVVTFGGGGIAPGGSAFISFEADGGASGGQITIGAPLPPAVWSGLALVLGIGAYTKFAKTKIA